VCFALKSTPSIGRAEFLHLVRTECTLVLPMKNVIIFYIVLSTILSRHKPITEPY